ncbi:MAG: VWA domain-containing protein [Acidobacteriota bacterium]
MIRPKLQQRFAATIVALSALMSTAVLAPAGAEDLFYDTVDVRVVNVDVTVTGEDGQPVADLGPDDFELLVDGRVVEISNFSATQGGIPVEGVSTLPATAERGAVDGPTPAPPAATDRLDLVILVDDVHLSARNRNPMLQDLRRHLVQELEDGDRVLVARLNDELRIEQPLTGDLDKVLETLEGLEKQVGRSLTLETAYRTLIRSMEMTRLAGTAVGGQIPTGNSRDADLTAGMADAEAGMIENLARQREGLGRFALDALRSFVDTLAGVKGRKALIYVGDGISSSPAESLVQAWQQKYEAWIIAEERGDLEGVMAHLISLDVDLTKELDDLYEYAASGGVAIYPVSSGSRLARAAGPADTSGSFYDDGRGPNSGTVTTLERFSTETTLLRMADETGGRAFTHSPNLGDVLGQVKQDFATFYSLGWSPDRETVDPLDVEVRVRRPGANVRYARSLLAKDPLDRLQDLTLSALHHGIEDNPLRVRLDAGPQESGVEGRVQVSMMVTIPFENLLLLPGTDHHSGRVSVFVIVRDEGSRGVSPFHHIELPLKVPNDRLVEVLSQSAAYPVNLQMTPGRKRISVGVRDHLARTDATLSVEIDVDAGTLARRSTP